MANAKLFLVIFVHITVVPEYVFSNGRVRICYFNAEARYRDASARFDVNDIDFTLCTHYVYAYARTIADNNTIQPMDPSVEPSGAYSIFTGRRSNQDIRRNVTLLLSLGGPDTTQHREFVEFALSEVKMQAFSNHVSDYLRYYYFDGIDLDWQYPTTNVMKWGFAKLLEIMRNTFDRDVSDRRILITVKCPSVYNSTAYDVLAMSRYADYIIIAAYNMPTRNPKEAWFGSPLYSKHITVNTAVQGWLRAGLQATKTVLGISPVGRFFRLESASAFRPGSAIRNEVLKGDHFKIPNGLAYPEICELFQNGTKYHDKATEMNYRVSGTNWVGYEDTESIEAKVYWVNVLGIAGVMFSAIDMNDFTAGKCSRGRFPLLQMIKQFMEPRKIKRPSGTPALGQNKAHRQESFHFFTIALACLLLYVQCY